MVRSWKNICLLLAISLAVVAVWPDFSAATQAPQLELLGEIKAGLRVPTRIDVDNSGNLYVADARLEQLVKFDKYGQTQLVVDQEKISGAGLAVTPAGDRIYASANDKVAVFDQAGELLGYLGRGAGEFDSAGSIALDRDGNIYVADLTQRLVKVFLPDASAAGQLGGASFITTSGLKFHPTTDLLYMTDSYVGSRAGIQPQLSVYSRSGSLQKAILASNGFGAAPLRFFGGMTFDSNDRFYIGDVEDMAIHVLDAAGAPLHSYTREGMSRPTSLAYDVVTNRLFVVQADHRIDIYGIDGAQSPVKVNRPPEIPIAVAPIGGSEVAVSQPSLSFNNAVDADEADQLSYNVRVFDAADNLVFSQTVVEQTDMTSVPLDIDLQENGFYRWQVQAFDGQVHSEWSALQSFYVNAVQEAPSAPMLLAPLAGAAVRTDALLQWQAVSDADPFDTVSYQLEVSAAADFSELLYSAELEQTELLLVDLSAQVEPGHTYYWQIKAIDNHGLSTVSAPDGSFIYQATVLAVHANMPGAMIYLAGNHGYAGQQLGTAPATFRDLPEGNYQLVVERAGFEPFYLPISLQLDSPTQIYADLLPARVPEKLSFQSLKVAGKGIKVGSMVTPLLADLDLDGIEDLLIAKADGSLQYHLGQLAKAKKKTDGREIEFGVAKTFAAPQWVGGTPCLVDWNNDYQQDLLIGTSDGAVWLYLNQGNFNFSDQPVLLAAVGSSAVPTVADIDTDGDKDLLVGSGDGELVLFLNEGSDGQPQLGGAKLLVVFAEAAAPTFADWDGDGTRELLIAAEGEIYHAQYREGALSQLSLVAAKGKPVERLFVHDLDVLGGKDLLAGTADGRILLASASASSYVAAFYPAIGAKLSQLEAALQEEVPELASWIQPMRTILQQKNLPELTSLVETLIAELPAEALSAEIASELANTLLY